MNGAIPARWLASLMNVVSNPIAGKAERRDSAELARRSELRTVSVAVLMCTANGERFLRPQLRSIACQTHTNFRLIVSDDGSVDGTVDCIEQYPDPVGTRAIEVRQGPCQGFAANFLSLACDKNIEADYFAFADQDDIWEPPKLERSLAWLETVSADTPALYCARTKAIDESGRYLGLSPLFDREPCFRNALVQSLAGGNTMVINRAARDLFASVGPIRVVAHDWWFYQLISGVGGLVFYDPEPLVQYRQHAQNIIGSNSNLRARWLRIREMFRGRFKRWNVINADALEAVRDLLTEDSRKVLDGFKLARSEGLATRIAAFKKAGIHRQTILGNAGLWAAVMMRKL